VTRAWVAVAVVLFALPSQLTAQSGLRGRLAGVLGFASVERQASDTTSGNGTAFGVEAMLGFGPAELAGRYTQGSVSGDQADDKRDLVQGDLGLRVRPLSAIWIGIGPSARSYVFEVGTERWFTWEARLGFESALGSDVLRAHLQIAYAFAGRAEPGGSLQGARRVEGGLGLRLPRTPIEIGVAYRLEQADIEADLATDIVEQFVLRAAIGR
jgi:hypothetical protein